MALTPEAMLGWTPFSYPFNLTQQPAITVPCGPRRPAADRPAARRPMFADALVLRAARAYEQLHPVPRPPI
jgi:aspartyl-tRNA(Asn)/glutamyl-tRNA(Gln) amidotransferase subunit A